MVSKAPALAGYPHESHFIGHLQSNKINALLGSVSCLETVDSVDLARQLDERLAAAGTTLEVLLQV